MSSGRYASRGTLYVLQPVTGGPVKIGWTAKGNALRRLRDAQTYHPSELVILTETPAFYSQERALHRLFNEYRTQAPGRGEWFRYEGLVSECLEYLREGGIDTFLDAHQGS